MTEGICVSEAERRLSISMKTLANRIRAARAGKLKRVGQYQEPPTEVEVELGRVKPDLAEVKMERDLLKNSRRNLRRSRGKVSEIHDPRASPERDHGIHHIQRVMQSLEHIARRGFRGRHHQYIVRVGLPP